MTGPVNVSPLRQRMIEDMRIRRFANSVAILMAGWFAPTRFGIAFVRTQAAAVGVVTELEMVGLKRSIAIGVPPAQRRLPAG